MNLEGKIFVPDIVKGNRYRVMRVRSVKKGRFNTITEVSFINLRTKQIGKLELNEFLANFKEEK